MYIFTRVFAPALLAAAIFLPPPALAAGNSDPRCNAPRELIEDEPQLPTLAKQFKEQRPINIVVIGGASTAGNGEASYPLFLETALRQHHPDIQINVLNRGVSGQTTEQMTARFPKDVYANTPSLMIWETGTVDAVRSENTDDFATTLTEGIAALRAHDVPVMMIDMQYNSSTVSVINFEPYLNALHQTAQLQDVFLFGRFDLMKYWSEAGSFDFINVPREKRNTLARDFYECLGERLADAIDYAAR
jgi:lysophospholipase L1-like esterase